MKLCLKCQAVFESDQDSCPDCGFLPEVVDGFCAYAPEFAHESSGFKSSCFSKEAELEEANFWFRARNQLLLWALGKYCPNFSSILEIGCGTGYALSGIAGQFPDKALYGSEIFTAGLNFASTRLPLASFMQMDARHIPYSDEFDVIGAFDVLEHIEEDLRVMQQANEALKPGGTLLITVPQHKWLWSAADDYACHVRRYTAANIHKKLGSSGFRIIRSTSFVSTLLPAMLASRLRGSDVNAENYDVTVEWQLSSWLNSVFLQFLRFELALIKAGFNFALGGSRLVVARKR